MSQHWSKPTFTNHLDSPETVNGPPPGPLALAYCDFLWEIRRRKSFCAWCLRSLTRPNRSQSPLTAPHGAGQVTWQIIYGVFWPVQVCNQTAQWLWNLWMGQMGHGCEEAGTWLAMENSIWCYWRVWMVPKGMGLRYTKQFLHQEASSIPFIHAKSCKLSLALGLISASTSSRE